MKLKTNKPLILLALAALPFLAGCATTPSEKVAQYIRSGNEAQAIAYVESVIAKISVNNDAEEDVKLCEKIWDSGLALEMKPKLEARQKQVEEERWKRKEMDAIAYVESVIAIISVDNDAKEEVELCKKFWDSGLALATKPKLEARQKQVEEERKERERQAKLKARAILIKSKKQAIFQRLQEEIFPAEQKLSESERSRGRALLDTFGEEQMPLLAEKCKAARKKYLEAEANLKELLKALEAEKIDLKANDVFQQAGRNWLSLAATYWCLRYTLTDFYSQFKIGVITSDELAAEDKDLAELFTEAEKN